VALLAAALAMPPAPGQKRYYQSGQRRGKELLLINRSGLRGTWTALDPNLRVTTVELKALTEAPAAGVNYHMMPEPTDAQKQVATTAAAELVAQGITEPELQKYRGTNGVMEMATVFGLFAPKQVAGMAKWAAKSRRNLGTSALILVGSFMLLRASGLVDAALFFGQGVIAWIKITKDAYMEANEWMAEAGEEVGSWMDYAKSWSRESYAAFFCALLAVYLQTGSTKSDDSSSTSSSPSSSGAATPVTPAATAAGKQQQEREGFQSELLAALASMQKSHAEEIQKLRSPPDKADENLKEISRLRKKVEAFENMARDDSGEPRKARRVASPARADVPATADPPAAFRPPPGLSRNVEVAMELPGQFPRRGNETEGEPASSSSPETPHVKKVIEELERRAVNAQDLVLKEIKRYKEIPEESWPLPKGFRARLMPSLLGYLYRDGKRAAETTERFLTDHGLEDCYTAKEMMSIAEQFDRYLLMDRQEGFINLPSSEYLGRRYHGLKLAFEPCKVKADWNKPKDAKAWKSKVDWVSCDHIDPRSKAKHGQLEVPEVDEEVRKEMETEAMMAKVKMKVQAGQEERATI
jgi:hypothetical protein